MCLYGDERGLLSPWLVSANSVMSSTWAVIAGVVELQRRGWCEGRTANARPGGCCCGNEHGFGCGVQAREGQQAKFEAELHALGEQTAIMRQLYALRSGSGDDVDGDDDGGEE